MTLLRYSKANQTTTPCFTITGVGTVSWEAFIVNYLCFTVGEGWISVYTYLQKSTVYPVLHDLNAPII